MLDLTYIIPDMETKTIVEERTEERKNRFNGESILLTKEEARIHDCIFLAEIMATLNDKTVGQGNSKHWAIMQKNIDKFSRLNPKAYMVLID